MTRLENLIKEWSTEEMLATLMSLKSGRGKGRGSGAVVAMGVRCARAVHGRSPPPPRPTTSPCRLSIHRCPGEWLLTPEMGLR